MIERIARIGESPETLVYDRFRVERAGFLSIITFRVGGKGYEMMDRGDAVVVLPVDFARRELYLLHEERPLKAFLSEEGREWVAKVRRDASTATGEAFVVPADAVCLYEIVAGGIERDKHTRLPKETPVEAALRELEEEAGLVTTPDRLRPLPPYCTTIGGSTERIHPFIADVSEPLGRVVPKGDGRERIDVLRMGWDDAFALLEDGRVETASLNVLLYRLKVLDLEERFRTADFLGRLG